jgi:hypothetical protein
MRTRVPGDADKKLLVLQDLSCLSRKPFCKDRQALASNTYVIFTDCTATGKLPPLHALA